MDRIFLGSHSESTLPSPSDPFARQDADDQSVIRNKIEDELWFQGDGNSRQLRADNRSFLAPSRHSETTLCVLNLQI